MHGMTGSVIQVHGLSRGFGPRAALEDVDLQVGAGEIHGVFGPRAAGKSTLLRVLAGLLPLDGGHACVLGRPTTAPELRGRVGLISADGPPAYRGISALENLIFAGRLGGLTQPAALARGRELLDAVGLDERAALSAPEAAEGTLERFAFARALMSSPAVLLVDELRPGPHAPVRATLRRLALTHALRGGCVVWAARRLDELQGFADGVTLLAEGRVRYAGSVEALAVRARGCAPAPLLHAA